MVKPREIRKGDMVRVVRIPPDLDDRADIGTPQAFGSALGKAFRVEGTDEYGYLELVIRQTSTGSTYTSDTIWIEPEFVELVLVRSMNAWFRRLLLILMIGGGFVGVALAAQGFSQAHRVIDYIMLLAFVGLNGYGIFLGVRLSDGSASLRHLRFYFALQIPFISSPVIVYRFATGLQVTIAIIQSTLRWDWRLGSEGQLAILSPAPWGIGINVVAIAIVLLLYSRLAMVPEEVTVSRPDQSPEPTDADVLKG